MFKSIRWKITLIFVLLVLATELLIGGFNILGIVNHYHRDFAESIDESRKTLNKVVVKEATTLSIGRTNDNNLCYENKFVSGKHAKLSYDGNIEAATAIMTTIAPAAIAAYIK